MMKNDTFFGPSEIIKIFLDVLIFITLALVGAYLLDLLLPPPSIYESKGKNLLMIFIQFFLSVVYVYFVSTAYETVVGRDPSRFYALEIFIVLFFLAQGQFFSRLVEFFRSISGVDIRSHYKEGGIIEGRPNI